MTKKTKQLIEFINHIEKDDSLSFCEEYINRLIYAPWLGYLTWAVKYKNIWVAVFDRGNSHYSYFKRVNGTWVILMSKFISLDIKIRKFYKKLKD